MYHFKGKNIHEKNFNDFDGAFSFVKKLRDGNIKLEKVKGS